MAWNPAIVQAAAGAGTGIFGSIMSSESARKNTNRTIKANRELAMYAYDRDMEMWHQQNAYNSPAEQMRRLKEAGLNPNMIYGTGVQAAGNASSMPKYNAPSQQYNYKPLDLSFIPEVLSRYQDTKLRQAQIDNIQAQTANTQAETLNKEVLNYILKIRGYDQHELLNAKEKNYWHDRTTAGQADAATFAGRTAEAKMRQEWQRLTLLSQQQQMNLLNQQIAQKRMSQMDIQNELTQAKTMFERQKNEWAKMGVTSADSPLLRIFVRMFNEVGSKMK